MKGHPGHVACQVCEELLVTTSAELTVQSCTLRHVVNLGHFVAWLLCFSTQLANEHHSTKPKFDSVQEPIITKPATRNQPQQAAVSCLLHGRVQHMHKPANPIPNMPVCLYTACLLPLQLMCDLCHAMHDSDCQHTPPQTISMQSCHACRLHWMPAKARADERHP